MNVKKLFICQNYFLGGKPILDGIDRRSVATLVVDAQLPDPETNLTLKFSKQMVGKIFGKIFGKIKEKIE
jgi:hypothetical protein